MSRRLNEEVTEKLENINVVNPLNDSTAIVEPKVTEKLENINIINRLKDVTTTTTTTGEPQARKFKKYLIKKQLYDEATKLHDKYVKCEYLTPV